MALQNRETQAFIFEKFAEHSFCSKGELNNKCSERNEALDLIVENINFLQNIFNKYDL